MMWIAIRLYYYALKGTEETVAIVDQVLDLIQEITPGYALKYNKFYIGLAQNNVTDNFVIFRAMKKFTRMEIRLGKSDDIEELMESHDLDLMEYDGRAGRYRIYLYPGDVVKQKGILKRGKFTQL
ncbi:MAG TPA: hypothetical protein GXZ24_01775 [Firmicutes bacterium]|nr:hypothetical protein [Bacillota bacterium]